MSLSHNFPFLLIASFQRYVSGLEQVIFFGANPHTACDACEGNAPSASASPSAPDAGAVLAAVQSAGAPSSPSAPASAAASASQAGAAAEPDALDLSALELSTDSKESLLGEGGSGKVFKATYCGVCEKLTWKGAGTMLRLIPSVLSSLMWQ
jgi:hypothetical protein